MMMKNGKLIVYMSRTHCTPMDIIPQIFFTPTTLDMLKCWFSFLAAKRLGCSQEG